MKPARNKTYHPKPVNRLGGLGLIIAKHVDAENKLPIIANDQTDLSVAYWLSFDEMVRGKSSEEAWSVVTCSLNVALILCERGIGNEFEPYLNKALEGAFRAKVRADKFNAWRYDGEAINDIREALCIHDGQIAVATKLEMADALKEVHKRIADDNVYRVAA